MEGKQWHFSSCASLFLTCVFRIRVFCTEAVVRAPLTNKWCFLRNTCRAQCRMDITNAAMTASLSVDIFPEIVLKLLVEMTLKVISLKTMYYPDFFQPWHKYQPYIAHSKTAIKRWGHRACLCDCNSECFFLVPRQMFETQTTVKDS